MKSNENRTRAGYPTRDATNRPFVSWNRGHADRLHVAMLVMLVCAGCGQQLMPTPNIYLGSHKDCFDDVPEVFRNNTVDVLYLTDRAAVNGEGGKTEYGADRSDSLAYGLSTVSIGREVSWNDLVSESRSATRHRDLSLSCTRIREMGHLPSTPVPMASVNGVLVDDPQYEAAAATAREAFTRFVSERVKLAPSRKEAFIFVHGFNNSFEYASTVIGELWHFMGRQGVPIVYTWPAGKSYAYDRESGEFTVFHLKQFLQLLASCSDIEKVHIIAHSRGTDVALTALRELNVEYKCGGQSAATRLKLGNVVLAAADLDIQVVKQRIGAERLPLMPERMTVYCSESDRAIEAAEWLFRSGRRIGDLRASDLTEDQRRNLALTTRVQIVQARVNTGLIGHDYFHSNPAVSSDLILLLRDNRAPGAENGRPLTVQFENFWSLDASYCEPRGK